MPYGIPKEKGGDSPENINKMESCVLKVMDQGHDKLSAIKICKSSLFNIEEEVKASEKNDQSIAIFAEMFLDKQFKAGDTVDIQIMRVGEWDHSEYGSFSIKPDTLTEVVDNFYSRARGIDLAVDENHEPNHRALGWFKDLYLKGKEALFATIELTKEGADILSRGLYKYFSPEIIFDGYDEEQKKEVKNVLIGGAFTNRPYFKNMESMMASEVANDNHDNKQSILITNKAMKEFLNLIETLSAKTEISIEEKDALTKAFDVLSVEDKEKAKADFDVQIAKAPKVEEVVEAPAVEVVAETVTETVQEPIVEAAVVEEKKEEVKIEASEKSSSNEFAELNAKFAEMKKEYEVLKKERRDAFIDSSIKSLLYNESTKTGSILPRQTEKLKALFSDMSDKHINQIVDVLKENAVINFNEVGTTEAKKDDVKPEFNPEHVAYYKEHGLSDDMAIAAAKKAATLSK